MLLWLLCHPIPSLAAWVQICFFFFNLEPCTQKVCEEFTFEDYLEKYGNKAIPMFLLDSRKRLSILSGLPSADQVPAGSRIVALVKAERVVEKIEEKKQDAAKAQ